MVVANIEDEKKASEAVWQDNGYFGDINLDFSIHKKDFPENALIYINQAYLTVKDGDAMIYCDYNILGQIISLRNSPENLDEAIENDKTKTLVKMFVPIYNNTTGQFLGVKETLVYIMPRNEPKESFCFSKQAMPNVFF